VFPHVLVHSSTTLRKAVDSASCYTCECMGIFCKPWGYSPLSPEQYGRRAFVAHNALGEPSLLACRLAQGKMTTCRTCHLSGCTCRCTSNRLAKICLYPVCTCVDLPLSQFMYVGVYSCLLLKSQVAASDKSAVLVDVGACCWTGGC
jgi:hypothetical protein